MSNWFAWFQHLKTVADCEKEEAKLIAKLEAVRARKDELKGEEVTEG